MIRFIVGQDKGPKRLWFVRSFKHILPFVSVWWFRDTVFQDNDLLHNANKGVHQTTVSLVLDAIVSEAKVYFHECIFHGGINVVRLDVQIIFECS